MGFSTTPITLEQAKELVQCHNEGEVVSATKEEYFGNFDWMALVETAEVKDDGLTIFFRLPDDGFVEYCFVKVEDMRL